ncbi:DUF5682 family protein [Rudaea sp. 3F27F6]|uniref:DUF5682 family protein n=1 Tax=Rudaea sp. 3F27F6 TaxID=2502208 RepID=UPI001BB1CA1F|nr:DUF5682 family protein [Rudaea sp. 3F27F6]
MKAEESTEVALPESLALARARLFGHDDIYFVPVRHHSPTCAFALRQLLKDVAPAVVLVEGPDDVGHLLPLMQHERTKAPVAWLCQATRKKHSDGIDNDNADKSETRTSFFPFCDYSPEWIAIREGAALGAQIALIDLPWSDKAWHNEQKKAADATDSLMEERHFAHSRYLGAMAAQLGCVDHHELWDRLFELRQPAALMDWRSFFGDVFAWCAMARLDYEPEVLEAELSLPRERHMANHVRHWRKAVKGPIVVVTGGFHTPELVMRWSEAKAKSRVSASRIDAGAWLIRYSFDRLDALNGYASGMPSPGYYQRIWDRLERDAAPDNRVNCHAAVALECLTSFARETREQDQVDAVSTAVVQAAMIQAQRLAALRGNIGPSRQDLLDAIRSCFIKGAVDEGRRGFTGDLRRFLGGTRIGDVPASAGSPPLVEDARRRALVAGVRVDDTTPRDARLDLYRKSSHRDRSRYFHAMAYLDTGLAHWLGGPDFLGNSRLNMLFEEWRVAWSPLVEARLVELAVSGASVEAVCMAKLRIEEEALAQQGRARSASAAVALIVRACLIGLHSQLPQMLNMLSAHLDEDAAIGSVIECGHRLVTLWRSREPLGVQQHPQLGALLQRAWDAALFLLPDLSRCQQGNEPQAIKQLLGLHELGRLIGALEQTDAVAVDHEPMYAELERFTSDGTIAAGVSGAAATLLYLDGRWSEATLNELVDRRFGSGAAPHEATRFLGGLMTAAPELLLRVPQLLSRLDEIIATWDDESFITYLADFRQSFAQLKPYETAMLAERVATLHGLNESGKELLLQTHYETAESDISKGTQMQLLLADSLRQSGLTSWIDIAGDAAHSD